MRKLLSLLVIVLAAFFGTAQAQTSGLKKVEDIVIYENEQFYSAFPSIVRRADGELIVAFRRAPNWRDFGMKGFTHTDANSYLVLVRSKDNGKTWSKEPEMIFAHPFGGSQDPCMLQLRDKSLICASYGWSHVTTNVLASLKKPFHHHGQYVFLGGYMVKSKDGGKTWGNMIVPPPRTGEPTFNLFGDPTPAYNRGAMCEGKDGRIYWVVASNDSLKPRLTSTHLMISDDKGETWKYSCPVAEDEKVTFNETSLYETPKGDLVAFMRTANFDDHTTIARSTDGGKSFQKWQDAGFKGHPHYALRLPDKRVLLVYGYRHVPYGIRARILDAECTNFASAEETVLRDDGGSYDIGYPWATMIGKNRALVVYYFNKADGLRHIAGTIVDIK
jgi:sialidase-1